MITVGPYAQDARKVFLNAVFRVFLSEGFESVSGIRGLICRTGSFQSNANHSASQPVILFVQVMKCLAADGSIARHHFPRFESLE